MIVEAMLKFHNRRQLKYLEQFKLLQTKCCVRDFELFHFSHRQNLKPQHTREQTAIKIIDSSKRICAKGELCMSAYFGFGDIFQNPSYIVTFNRVHQYVQWHVICQMKSPQSSRQYVDLLPSKRKYENISSATSTRQISGKNSESK